MTRKPRRALFANLATAIQHEAYYRRTEAQRVANTWEWAFLDPVDYHQRAECIHAVYGIGSQPLSIAELQAEDRRCRAWFYHQHIQTDHSKCERCTNR
jgi:hypothetical protein